MSEPKANAPKSGKKRWMVLVVVSVISIGAGVLAPHLMKGMTSPASETPKPVEPKDAFLPFGDVTVNLADGRLSRFLRVKIVLMIDGNQEAEITKLVEQRKAILKSWLIAHLSDKSLAQVTGRVSVNRARREILEQFNQLLSADGKEPIRDVLFEEFVVQ